MPLIQLLLRFTLASKAESGLFQCESAVAGLHLYLLSHTLRSRASFCGTFRLVKALTYDGTTHVSQKRDTRHPVDTTQEAVSQMFEAAGGDVIFKIGSLENDTSETQN